MYYKIVYRSGSLFRNYKHFYSIILFAVVYSNYYFICESIGLNYRICTVYLLREVKELNRKIKFSSLFSEANVF